MEQTRDCPPDRRGAVIAGLIVMGIGTAFLLERTAAWDFDVSPRLWPTIPLTIGLVRMLAGSSRGHGRRRSPGAGTALVFVGCWGLLNEFRVFGLDYDTSWPLVVIFAGVSMVWRAWEDPSAASAPDRQR